MLLLFFSAEFDWNQRFIWGEGW